MFDDDEDEREIIDFYDDENYTMKAEIYQGCVYGHLTVHKEGPSVMRHIKRNWDKALQKTIDEGYQEFFAYTKNPRFVSWLGGSQYLTNVAYEGEIYEVYRWELLQ